MLVVTMHYEVEADSLEIFRAAATRQAEVTRSREIGCQRYDVSFDTQIPTRALIYAVFDNDHAYDHHIGTDHTRVFENLIVERVASHRIEFWDLNISGRRVSQSPEG